MKFTATVAGLTQVFCPTRTHLHHHGVLPLRGPGGLPAPQQAHLPAVLRGEGTARGRALREHPQGGPRAQVQQLSPPPQCLPHPTPLGRQAGTPRKDPTILQCIEMNTGPALGHSWLLCYLVRPAHVPTSDLQGAPDSEELANWSLSLLAHMPAAPCQLGIFPGIINFICITIAMH